MPISSLNVAIVIPSYNEGGRLEQVVREITEGGYNNVIVVDDGSTDNSIDRIKKYNVTILRHLINRGAGAATETGMAYCRDIINADTVVMFDADTQHDVNDISKLLEEHKNQGADITIGNRFLKDADSIPFKNWSYNQIANVVTMIFAGKRVSDSQSGFKVFGKRALQRIILEQDKYEHCSEIIIKAFEQNLKIIEIPIRVYYRPEISGKGQHFLNGIRTFVNLLHSVLFRNHSK